MFDLLKAGSAQLIILEVHECTVVGDSRWTCV
jgi:hypothetical protein